MPLSLALVQPLADVISRRLGPSAVLVHLATNRIYELNETGVFIWEGISRGESAEAIVTQLTAHFDVDAETAERELARLTNRLVEQGLATWAA